MIIRDVEWNCDPSAEARVFAGELESWLSDVWAADNVPWLCQLPWWERAIEWFWKHVKFGGGK